MKIKLYEMEPMSKQQALLKVKDYLVENQITDPEYYDGIILREKQAPFYIGNFIAIPHSIPEYTKYIKTNGLVVLRFKKAIEWDGEQVHYVIGIASKGGDHMDVLSNIANSFCEEELTLASLKIDLDKLIEHLAWE